VYKNINYATIGRSTNKILNYMCILERNILCTFGLFTERIDKTRLLNVNDAGKTDVSF